jgi:outer membrane protein assembly factor BamB
MPQCLIFIVDESASMSKPTGELKPSLVEGLATGLNEFLSDGALADDLRVGIIGYRQSADFQANTLETGFRGLGNTTGLVPLHQWRSTGGVYRPQPAGQPNCVSAFELALDSVRSLVKTAASDSVTATLVHLSGGGTSQLGEAPRQLASIEATGADLNVFHLEFLRLPVGRPAEWFPSRQSTQATPFAQWMLATASEVPTTWSSSPDRPTTVDSRAAIIRARKKDWLDFLAQLRSYLVEQARASRIPPTPSGKNRRAWRSAPIRPDSTKVYGRVEFTPEGYVIAACDACVTALDATDGRETWRWQSPGMRQIACQPVWGRDGGLRVHVSDGMVYSLDAASGQERWRVNVGPPNGCASPLLDGRGNTYIAIRDGGLIRLDATGQAQPFHATADQLFPPPATFNSTGFIHEERLYIGADDQHLHAIALGAAGGEDCWNAWETQAGRTRGAINTGIALSPRRELIVASSDDNLYGFDLDGRVIWMQPLGGLAAASPIIDARGGIYVAVNRYPASGGARKTSRSGYLLLIDSQRPEGRREIWATPLDGAITSTPVLGDDGIIYVASDSGQVYAIDAHGVVVWTEALAAPVRAALSLVAPNLLLVPTTDGSVTALRCDSLDAAAQGWPQLRGPLAAALGES